MSYHPRARYSRRSLTSLAAYVTLAMVAVGGLATAASAAEPTSRRLDGKALQMCDGEYAICDAAECTPIAEQAQFPGAPLAEPSTAFCRCRVVTGANLGPGPCSDRAPVVGPNGRYIMSTYSYALAGDLFLSCPGGGQRTVCFGYPCVVDKADPTWASCTCPILYDTKPFATQGGDCNVASCTNGLWQGGTPAEYEVINTIFTNATGQQPPPACNAIVKEK